MHIDETPNPEPSTGQEKDNRPLTETGLKNVAAAAQLAGYLRYFYPGDEASAADWDKLIVTVMDKVEGIESAEELALTLQDALQPVAPALQVLQTGKEPKPESLEFRAGAEIVQWQHDGVSLLTHEDSKGEIYNSARSRSFVDESGEIPSSFEDPRKLFEYELGAGIKCAFPLSVLAEKGKTIPVATKKPDYSDTPVEDMRAARFLGVTSLWSTFQHFYPYFDVVSDKWNGALEDMLQKAAVAEGRQQLREVYAELVAKLDDGHGAVYDTRAERQFFPAFHVSFLGGEMVVVDIAEGDSLKLGDIVRRIDGIPVEKLREQRQQLISAATEGWREQQLCLELLTGAEDSELVLHIERDGAEIGPIFLTRKTSMAEAYRPDFGPRPEHNKEVEAGIWYYDLQKASNKEFVEMLPQFESAEAIIFDLRSYPEIDSFFLQYLLDKPCTSTLFQVPRFSKPNQEDRELSDSGHWTLEPLEPRITAKVVFLTDHRAISYAESLLGIIEEYGLGEIVGSSSAGTNGNINPTILPGGYKVLWTGMLVEKHDGSQHHGIGIQPTIPVLPTVAGVRAGKDEVFEAALEHIRTLDSGT